MGLNRAALDWLLAGGILVVFLLAALAARLATMWALRPLVRRWAADLDETLLVPVRGLITSGLILMGVLYSVRSLSGVAANGALSDLLGRIFAVGWAVLAIWTLLRVFNGAVTWYVHREARRSSGARQIGASASLVRKTVNILAVAVGALYVLRIAGADISPLLASGAIGGLAVALALQDTLSNVFSGYWLSIDRPVRSGDFVKLESGEEGFVEEIGWRNTRIRMLADIAVVVPNAKLSQSILTNYFLPQPSMSVYVPCGVSYDSDLQRVENVALDVIRQVQRSVDGADPDWEPVVRWKEFGEHAVTFTAVLRVRDFGAQYLLQSEFVKALHRRFRDEGIEIPYPTRTVLLRGGAVWAGERGEGAPAELRAS